MKVFSRMRRTKNLRGLGRDEWDAYSQEDTDYGAYYSDYSDFYSEPEFNPSSHTPAEDSTLPVLDRIFNIGTRLAEGYLSYQQQSELNEINLDRAKRGLAPLDVQMYKAQAAPRVNVALAPDQQKMLMYGGIALLAVFMLKKRN